MDLLGGLRRADMRGLVKRNKFEDLLGVVCALEMASWEVLVEQGKHQDSGSCEALRFKLVDKATFGSSDAVDEIEIFFIG